MTEEQKGVYGIVNNIMRLEKAINFHTLKDELCGDHVVMSIDITNEFIRKIKADIMMACKKELERKNSKHRYCADEKALVDAIKLMNLELKDAKGKRNTNEPKPSDGIRETNLGETLQQDLEGCVGKVST